MSEEESKSNIEYKKVKVKDMLPSTILSMRQSSDFVKESVKQQGTVDPILICPHPEYTNKYEILAGHLRWNALMEKDPEALVDCKVYYGLSEFEKWKIAMLSNISKKPNAWEMAEYVTKGVELVGAQGTKNPKIEVAKMLFPHKTIESAQVYVSQYLKIDTLRQVLLNKTSFKDLINIKSQKEHLYALTWLIDHKDKIKDTIDILKTKEKWTPEELRKLKEKYEPLALREGEPAETPETPRKITLEEVPSPKTILEEERAKEKLAEEVSKLLRERREKFATQEEILPGGRKVETKKDKPDKPKELIPGFCNFESETLELEKLSKQLHVAHLRKLNECEYPKGCPTCNKIYPNCEADKKNVRKSLYYLKEVSLLPKKQPA